MKKVAEVAVDDRVKYPALLGMDLGRKMGFEMITLGIEKMENKPSVEPEVEQQAQATLPVISSVENDGQSLVEKAVEIVVAQDASEPVSLADIFDLEDEFFEQDLVADRGSISCIEPVKFCEILGDQAVCFSNPSVEIASLEKCSDLTEAEVARNFDDSCADLQQDGVVSVGRNDQSLGSTHREGLGVSQKTVGSMIELAGGAKVKMKNCCRNNRLVLQSADHNFLHMRLPGSLPLPASCFWFHYSFCVLYCYLFCLWFLTKFCCSLLPGVIDDSSAPVFDLEKGGGGGGG